MPKQEVYHSSTLGPIPLSFTGRHLLQALRTEFTDLVAAAKDGKIVDWQAVSRARGRIAQYMSQLEGKQNKAQENANALFGKFAFERNFDACAPRYFYSRCTLQPLLKEESPAEMLARLGTDAHKWAVEFLRKFPRIHPDIADTDEVRAWFANAIEHAKSTVKAAPVVNNVHLPEIPEGYELEQVGNITRMAPIQEIQMAPQGEVRVELPKDKMYHCVYVRDDDNFEDGPMVQKTTGGLVTRAELGGEMTVKAESMEAALKMAVAEATRLGFKVTERNFTVRLLGEAA